MSLENSVGGSEERFWEGLRGKQYVQNILYKTVKELVSKQFPLNLTNFNYSILVSCFTFLKP